MKSMTPLLLGVKLILLMVACSAADVTDFGDCTDELTAMSPCLPYISAPPNNFSSSPSRECCDLFSSAFNTGGAVCFCYLLRQPQFLGFPLNVSRVISLSSPFALKDGGGSANIVSLDPLCEGTVVLPSPMRGMPPDSAVSSPTPESSSPELSTNPSPLQSMESSCYQFLPGIIMLFLVSSFAYML